MNIFNNQQYYSDPIQKRHQEYLKWRGITESQYQEEQKQKREQEHQELLKRLGITEEVFQKREKRKAKTQKIKENLLGCFYCSLPIIGFIAFFALALVISDSVDKSTFKDILLVLGIIWIVFLLVLF